MVRVFPDLNAAATALAARVAAEAATAIAARGELRLGLSGGETPLALYRVLASEAWRGRVDWSRVVMLFADERAVPRGAPDRNDRLVREALVVPLGLREARLEPMRGEADDLDAAAREYERAVASPIDLLLLGVGVDGHIASLFPRHPAVGERRHRVVAVLDSPKPPPRRLTLTPRAIDEARVVCVLTAGEAKAAAVAKALEPSASADECPAALVAQRDWYVDRAAASGRAQAHSGFIV